MEAIENPTFQLPAALGQDIVLQRMLERKVESHVEGENVFAGPP